MDGSFACPECGSDVEVRGLAPGRQVRCGFCHRLLEVPYLPRAAGRILETPSFRAAEMGPLGLGRARPAPGRRPWRLAPSVSEAAVRFDSGSVDQPVARVVAAVTKPTGDWAKPWSISMRRWTSPRRPARPGRSGSSESGPSAPISRGATRRQFSTRSSRATSLRPFVWETGST